MKTLKKYVLLLLVLVITVFTSNAQSTDSTTVYESYIFHKDSVLAFDYGRTNTYWAIIPYSKFDPSDIIKDTVQNGNVLNLVKKFNSEVAIDSIYMNFIRYTNNITGDFNVFNINNGSYYSLPQNVYNLQKTYSFIDFRADYVKLSYLAANEISTRLYILNPTIFYHYTKSNTSINEVLIVNDIKFINNKFETTSKIDNIKVYDITGKVISEGKLTDIYLLEKNTLYFILFNNKYSKKIYLTN